MQMFVFPTAGVKVLSASFFFQQQMLWPYYSAILECTVKDLNVFILYCPSRYGFHKI